MKFRKKPVVIEAEQYSISKEIVGVQSYFIKTGNCPHCGYPWLEHGLINTLEGQMAVCPDDWVITGVAGEKYPCKPDIFEKTYEKVGDKE